MRSSAGSETCSGERSVAPAKQGSPPARSRRKTLTRPVGDQSTSPGSASRLAGDRRPRVAVGRDRVAHLASGNLAHDHGGRDRAVAGLDAQRVRDALRVEERAASKELLALGRGARVVEQLGARAHSASGARSRGRRPQSSTSSSSSPRRTWSRITPSEAKPTDSKARREASLRRQDARVDAVRAELEGGRRCPANRLPAHPSAAGGGVGDQDAELGCDLAPDAVQRHEPARLIGAVHDHGPLAVLARVVERPLDPVGGLALREALTLLEQALGGAAVVEPAMHRCRVARLEVAQLDGHAHLLSPV